MRSIRYFPLIKQRYLNLKELSAIVYRRNLCQVVFSDRFEYHAPEIFYKNFREENMYCPRCGEQQNSGNLRFCNRCGLPLGLVSEVLSNGGTLPQLEKIEKNRKWFTRSNGIKFSFTWFALWLFITFLVAVSGGDDATAVTFVLGFFGGILLMFLSFLFLKSPSKIASNREFIQNQNAIPQHLSGQQNQQNALPPQQAQPAEDYISPPAGMWKAPDTGDLVEPGSVTEGTTKLLSKDEEDEQAKYIKNQ